MTYITFSIWIALCFSIKKRAPQLWCRATLFVSLLAAIALALTFDQRLTNTLTSKLLQ